MEKQFENFKLRYTIGGLIIGLLLSLTILIITLEINNYDFSFHSIIEINKENPINILLLISPFLVISVLAYFAGAYTDSINQKRLSDNELSNNRFESIKNFIDKLRKGETIQKTDDFSDTDKIGKSLMNLKDELEKSKEEEDSRQKEDSQRSWTSGGLALFGAVLREYNENIDVLANKVINELVKYIDAKQAGFYLTDLSDPNNWVIREVANFAYGRKRFANKEFNWGEGLIGACINEKKSTFIDNIDENYFEIESGLGSAKPRSILIVPIITEEGIIHGALEISSFKIYEDFEIMFVEQIAASIAVTISTLKINEETARLLKESREQAEVLTRQEDELRKTISDMRRLQENADIQSVAFRSYQDSTNKALIRAEFSNNGNLEFANKRFLDLFGYKSNTEVQDKHISNFIDPKEDMWFENVSNEIINKNKHFEGILNHVSKTGKNLWIESSYIGMRNDKGKVEKILFLGIDATDLKLNAENLQNKIKIINNSVYKMDLSPSDDINNIGIRLLNFLNYTNEDILNKNIHNFIPDQDKQAFKVILENVKTNNQVYEGDFSLKDKNNNVLRFFTNIFCEKDANDNLVSVSVILFDYNQEFLAKQKIFELEKTVSQLNENIQESREKFNRRIELAREEMKELYTEIETSNIFYETTLSLLPDAVITLNNENEIIYVNKSVLELWASLDDVYTGNDVSTLFPKLGNKQKGTYLGDRFNINLKEKVLGDRENVYIIDKEGKRKELTMLMTEVSLGLRKRLTVFLQR
ncbi:MAG: PAS domain-containing protein [Bacteroidales bacterium]|nr:PAS domain-containing protein [Bacteroidales bacterium]